jgi:cytidylate kinase
MKKRMYSQKNVIWDGRLACFLAKDKKDILKVFCKSNFETRVERTSVRDNISLEKARNLILKREKEEAGVFNRLYGLENPYKKEWIDIFLDTSNQSPEALALSLLPLIQ